MRKITMEFKEYHEDLNTREQLGFNFAVESLINIAEIKDNDKKFSELFKISTDLKFHDGKTIKLAEMVGLDRGYLKEKLYPKRSKK